MRTMQVSENILSKPIWLHDEYANYNLLPNGAILKPESVPMIQNGKVYSGSLVGRNANMKKFALISPTAADLNYNNATTLAADALATDTLIKVSDVDGYVAGQAITVGGSAATIASVSAVQGTITLAAALGAARAAGSAVVLTTPVAHDEIYLMATNILNAYELSEFTLLRHQRMIYQNKLPDWATTSMYVRGLIRARYVCLDALA